jgi:hypothetical protein
MARARTRQTAENRLIIARSQVRGLPAPPEAAGQTSAGPWSPSPGRRPGHPRAVALGTEALAMEVSVLEAKRLGHRAVLRAVVAAAGRLGRPATLLQVAVAPPTLVGYLTAWRRRPGGSAPSRCRVCCTTSVLVARGERWPRAVDAGKRGLGQPARHNASAPTGAARGYPGKHNSRPAGSRVAGGAAGIGRAGGWGTVTCGVSHRSVTCGGSSLGPRPCPGVHPTTACRPARHPGLFQLAC